uniref:Pyr_redox_dim domain-containing protein n=1 Tax=Rodentolepis nana TaxID=102285 RepID=A0A0R3T830_RODNA
MNFAYITSSGSVISYDDLSEVEVTAKLSARGVDEVSSPDCDFEQIDFINKAYISSSGSSVSFVKLFTAAVALAKESAKC